MSKSNNKDPRFNITIASAPKGSGKCTYMKCGLRGDNHVEWDYHYSGTVRHAKRIRCADHTKKYDKATA